MSKVKHVKEDELWSLPQVPFLLVELPTSIAQCWK